MPVSPARLRGGLPVQLSQLLLLGVCTSQALIPLRELLYFHKNTGLYSGASQLASPGKSWQVLSESRVNEPAPDTTKSPPAGTPEGTSCVVPNGPTASPKPVNTRGQKPHKCCKQPRIRRNPRSLQPRVLRWLHLCRTPIRNSIKSRAKNRHNSTRRENAQPISIRPESTQNQSPIMQ